MLSNANPDQLHLVQGNEFIPQISSWITVGGGVLVSTFGAAVTLASVLHYTEVVKAPATIRPAGELRLVQAAIEGTVKQITAEENQQVKKGEVIARIDDSRLQTQKKQLQSSIEESELQILQADNQIANLEGQIAAETNLMNRNISSAQAELVGVQRNYQDQQIKAKADMIQAKASLGLAKIQLRRLYHEKVLVATVKEAEATLELAKVQRNRLQPILKSGAISPTLFEEKELAVKAAQAKLEQAKAASQNLLEEKQQTLQTAQINLTKAKTAINPSNAAINVALERIQQEKARGKATLAALNKERQTLLRQRLELQNQRDRSYRELKQLEIDLSQTVIRAPISGMLLQLNLRNPQQVVRAGDPVAYIAPLHAPLLIKARVEAQDIDKVKAGQQIQMQVSACPYPDYGTLNGTVKSVASDILPVASNLTNTPTQAVYEVTIQPQTMFVGSVEHPCPLKPGMEGRSDIISRQEMVLQFLLRKTRLLTSF
jgi:multidrug efflux pump subunit AcrA (membrane-fusion protein)